MSEIVISAQDLGKVYRTGLRMKRVTALVDATFEVHRGEVFGFVGPNGAGKTTTIRILTGLIRPSTGRASILGLSAPSRKARARLGFLPEAPYFYDYLSGREFLDLCGRLFGLDAQTRRRRTAELLDRVGLVDAADRPMRKYSKGMLQRAGLAQALINDPELVILDEPMSGLDPVGRKDVRDLVLELRDQGKTVFFSTHILPDVEAMADRVAIIARGRVRDVGSVGKLLDATVLSVDVVLEASPQAPQAALDLAIPPGFGRASTRRADRQLIVSLEPAELDGFLRHLAKEPNVRVLQVTPRKESLEDLFVRRAS